MAETLLAYVVQSAAAAGLAGALLSTWGVRRPPVRLGFWLLALILPALLHPLLGVAVPVRASAPFRQSVALFVAARWTELPVGSWRLGPVLAWLVAALGLALYLRDLVPALRQGWRARVQGVDGDPRREDVAQRLAAHAARFGVAPPGTGLVPDDGLAYLYCRGFLSPSVVVSTGALAALSPDELDTALAHEVGHLSGRHLALGWGLIAVRSVLFFNPVAQVLGRTAVLEMERAADDAAAAATGRPAALASALGKLGVLADNDGMNLPGGLRFDVVKGRLLRLSESAAAPEPDAPEGLMLALAAGAVALLVFFVVA
jgi:Zn-dependent protease with chaperone function